jgi:hypothetical protein
LLRYLPLIGFVSYFWAPPFASARDHWTELNIGPFYVDTDSDTGAARDALNQLEQLRWVLGGLLESKDLPSLWPIRVLITNSTKTNPNVHAGEFVSQNGQCLLLTAPGTRLPLDQVAKILLDANTPRLPPEVESGLPALFGTLEAHGSHVTWGGPPAHSDPAWARMQLFATRFEYMSSFHILISSLRGGSSFQSAERNAFGKAPDVLEREVIANLAAHNWQAVSVSGRALDPRRDFGEHSLDAAIAGVYLADIECSASPKTAEIAYKAAVEASGPAAALGYEGLANIAKLEKADPKPLLEDAIRAGSKSAPVYVAAAEDQPAAEALPLLKKAAQLNPLWAEPIFRQAQLASNPAEKEALLKKATQLEPRVTEYWIELAQVQAANGHASAAQGSWLRAEDSASTEAERERIHQLNISSEQERLEAAEAERRREREAVHLADQQAQQSEADRIRAAEEKANQTLDSQAGGAKPSEIVPWDSVVPKKKLKGTLIKVDCLRSGARLSVKADSGQITQLFLRNTEQLNLSCGLQNAPRRVSISYAAQPDESRHTAGNVTNIEFQ